MSSLRARLAQTPGQTVVIVVSAATLLRNPVNATLLERAAEQTGRTFIIVTRDRATRHAARRVHIPVYHAIRSIPAKRRGDVPADQIAAAQDLRGAPLYRYAVWPVLLLTGLAALVFGLTGLAAMAVVISPAATVTVAPATETITTTVSLAASPQIRVVDAAKGQLPARPVQIIMEDTGVAETTGSKLAPDAAATGTVLFANRTQSPVTIPVSTTVRTATGASVRFRTEEEAQLPAGANGTVRVPIKAVEGGPAGNVKAGTINAVEGPLVFQVSVINDEDAKGGTTKQQRYVTLQDRSNLRDAIVQKIRAHGFEELLKVVQPGDILPQETLTLSVNDASFDKPLDAEGQYLTGKVRATVSGLVLDADEIALLVAARLKDQVPPGFVILPQGVSTGMPTNVTYGDGTLSLQLSPVAVSQAQLDPVQVQRLAAGKQPQDAVADIARRFSLASKPVISLSSDVLGRLPLFTSRIKVNVEQPSRP